MSEHLTIEYTVWARRDPYRVSDEDPEFAFMVLQGDGKPYWDDAFAVSKKVVDFYFELPADTITPQIDSLAKAKEAAKDELFKTVREYDERIQSLLALPQPE